MTLITGVLELQYLENRGMAFGMLQGRQMLFSCTVHSFLRCNVVAFLQNSQNRILHSTDSGRWYSDRRCGRNFIDRAFRGYVVDFIYVSLIDFPIFNLADIYVVCGGIALVMLVPFHYRDEDFDFIKK